jgi:hypothetical protein
VRRVWRAGRYWLVASSCHSRQNAPTGEGLTGVRLCVANGTPPQSLLAGVEAWACQSSQGGSSGKLRSARNHRRRRLPVPLQSLVPALPVKEGSLATGEGGSEFAVSVYPCLTQRVPRHLARHRPAWPVEPVTTGLLPKNRAHAHLRDHTSYAQLPNRSQSPSAAHHHRAHLAGPATNSFVTEANPDSLPYDAGSKTPSGTRPRCSTALTWPPWGVSGKMRTTGRLNGL